MEPGFPARVLPSTGAPTTAVGKSQNDGLKQSRKDPVRENELNGGPIRWLVLRLGGPIAAPVPVMGRKR